MPVSTALRPVAGNLPDTISGLQLWLDASQPGSAPADGDPVGTWKDLSGNGRDLTQATAGKRPLWRGSSRNLLTYNQATVETDTTGLFARSNTTIARSTAQARHGTACVTSTAIAAGDTGVRTTSPPSGILVTVGVTYTAVASYKAATNPRTIRTAIDWYDAANSYLSSSTAQATSSTSVWTQVAATAAAPANATQAIVGALAIATGAAGEVHYVDQLGFWQGASTTWVPPVTLPGGQPAIQFDGADDVLSAAVAVGQPATVYVVHRADTTGTARSWVAGDTTFLGTSTTAYQTYAGTALTTGTPNTTAWHVVDGVFNGASSTIAEGGNVGAAGAAGAAGFSALNIGALNAASQFMQGSLAAVLVYSGAHDTNTRKRVERWLAQRYAITVAQ